MLIATKGKETICRRIPTDNLFIICGFVHVAEKKANRYRYFSRYSNLDARTAVDTTNTACLSEDGKIIRSGTRIDRVSDHYYERVLITIFP